MNGKLDPWRARYCKGLGAIFFRFINYVPASSSRVYDLKFIGYGSRLTVCVSGSGV
jgi:hypothetical protein